MHMYYQTCLFTFRCALQKQLSSLEEKKKHSDWVIHTLQNTVQQKEAEIQELSLKIAAKEGELRQHGHAPDATEKHHTVLVLELEDMKMNIIKLEEHADGARTGKKLAQEEASYYQKHAVALLTAFKSAKVC